MDEIRENTNLITNEEDSLYSKDIFFRQITSEISKSLHVFWKHASPAKKKKPDNSTSQPSNYAAALLYLALEKEIKDNQRLKETLIERFKISEFGLNNARNNIEGCLRTEKKRKR